MIPSERVDGYAICKKVVTDGDEARATRTSYRHTYLVIMVNYKKTMPWWKSLQLNWRGVILIPSFLRDNIFEGYCIAIRGTPVEFYHSDYDSVDPIQPYDSIKITKTVQQDINGNQVATTIERKVHWTDDLTKEDLELLSDIFEYVAAQDVEYLMQPSIPVRGRNN